MDSSNREIQLDMIKLKIDPGNKKTNRIATKFKKLKSKPGRVTL